MGPLKSRKGTGGVNFYFIKMESGKKGGYPDGDEGCLIFFSRLEYKTDIYLAKESYPLFIFNPLANYLSDYLLLSYNKLFFLRFSLTLTYKSKHLLLSVSTSFLCKIHCGLLHVATVKPGSMIHFRNN